MEIGAHVSIAGGFSKCIERAAALGANCLQTFASSPRSLSVSAYSLEELVRYKEIKNSTQMGPHFFHGVYLVNLASEKKDYVQASVDSLIFYQQLAGKIGGAGTIFHIGSHKGVGFGAVKNQVVGAIDQVLQNTPDGVKLFLENAAGHKGVIGDRFEELGEIIKALPNKEKVAVCLDTQHAFASGYGVRTQAGIDLMIADFDLYIGLDHLKVVHANDSMMEFNSRRDRHQNIGEGFIGEGGFRLMLAHPVLKNLPWILEVPGTNKSGPRKEDVGKLKELADGR